MSIYYNHQIMCLIAIVVLSLCTTGTSMPAEVKPTLSPEQPPLVFPEDSTKYKIIPNNSSILRTLTHPTNNENPSSAEVFDMLHSQQGKVPIVVDNKGTILQENNSDVSPDLQNELLERIGAVVDKDREKKGDVHGNSDSEAGKWGAVIAAVILAIAAAAYLAMVLWRKSLERKYGSRQVLVNEDDNITNTFKHPVVI